jgi:hypothetical protein
MILLLEAASDLVYLHLSISAFTAHVAGEARHHKEEPPSLDGRPPRGETEANDPTVHLPSSGGSRLPRQMAN